MGGPELSASGKNAYYLDNCAFAEHRPAYAACIARIDSRKHGRLPTCFAACSAAIGRKECPAMALRHEELVKGEAIYFIDRTALTEANAEREHAESEMLNRLSNGSLDRKKKTRTKMPVGFASGSYADAINAALKSAAPAPEPELKPEPPKVEAKPVAPAPVGIRPGMSIQELAALMRGQTIKEKA